MNNITNVNPNTIWGAHFHMDVAPQDISKAIRIQQKFVEFLASEQIKPSHSDISTPGAGVFKPGYGPHKQHMWEVRLEKEPTDRILEDIGVGATWLSMNRNGLKSYVHPLTYDKQRLDLDTEAEDHKRALWLDSPSDLNLDFFYHPPKDPSTGSIVDTRTPNWISSEEQKKIVDANTKATDELTFVNPRQELVNGFHIHLDFTPEQRQTAFAVYAAFLKHLETHQIVPSGTVTYEASKDSPHVLAGWLVKFESPNPDVMKVVGRAIGWLMLNRQELPVFIHPITWKDGDVEAEVKAHKDYIMCLGNKPPLDLEFFKRDAQLKTVTYIDTLLSSGEILIGRTKGVSQLSELALSILDLLGAVLSQIPTLVVDLTKTIQPLMAWTGFVDVYNRINAWRQIATDMAKVSAHKIALTVAATGHTFFRVMNNMHNLKLVELGRALNPFRSLSCVCALSLTALDFWSNVNQLSEGVQGTVKVRTWIAIAFDVSTFALVALVLAVPMFTSSSSLLLSMSVLGVVSNLTDTTSYFLSAQGAA